MGFGCAAKRFGQPGAKSAHLTDVLGESSSAAMRGVEDFLGSDLHLGEAELRLALCSASHFLSHGLSADESFFEEVFLGGKLLDATFEASTAFLVFALKDTTRPFDLSSLKNIWEDSLLRSFHALYASMGFGGWE